MTTTIAPVSTRRLIGASVPRLEDRRLILGEGEYTDDVPAAGALHVAFLRSPYAHAAIRAIDVRAARVAPGVRAVYTGEDYRADGRRPIAHAPEPGDSVDLSRRGIADLDGAIVHDCRQQVLVAQTVLHQGEAVAFVVADSLAQAAAAAALIDVRYEPLDVAVTIDQASAAGAPQLFAGVPGNLAVDATRGEVEQTDAAFRTAAHVVEGVFHTQRIFSAHMEPRAALAEYDVRSGILTLTCGGASPVRFRQMLAETLDLPWARVHVRMPDTGGSFGSRNVIHPEAILCAWAAYKLQHAVRWTGTRSDGFLTDHQGRDLRAEGALALDAEGRILALRTTVTANLGAYSLSYSFLNNFSRVAPTVYAIPAATIRMRAVLTNTTPITAFRGAGRPEAVFVLERLLDLGARRIGLERTEIRRRNLIRETPYRTATGMTYDCGDFAGNMELALQTADWEHFEQRRAESASRGRLRGIGLANYLEIPVGSPRERVIVQVLPNGTAEVLIGTMSSGQGHETTFAQIAADLLGIPIRAVRFIQGDTRRIEVGGGSHSNRSMRLGSALLARACADIRDQAKAAAGSDEYDLFEVAQRAPLIAQADMMGRLPAYPTGSAVCEIELDPHTGEVTPLRYTQVDDVGMAINPQVVHGQVHGGIAQGLGQAFGETMSYDPSNGQVLSGSFMTYALPRAKHIPPLDVILVEDRTFSNPLHIKGGGEGGVTPSPAAAVSAVVDALRDYDIDHLEMPLTAPSIWRAIGGSKARA